MTQTSGPLVGANFTDAMWRAIFGGEPGIVGDTTGTAYKLTIPTSSDMLGVGTTSGASEDSRSVVAGFGHQIPAGSPEEIEIPTVSGGGTVGRTDLVVVRYDPSWTTAPGPCRLHRIAGTVGSATPPAYDDGPPGVEDMPLWQITRKSGQSLTQVAAAGQIRDVRRWIGPSMHTSANVADTMPLGTSFLRDSMYYVRRLGAGGSPEWFGANLASLDNIPWSRIAAPASVATFGAPGTAPASGWTNANLDSYAELTGRDFKADLRVRLIGTANSIAATSTGRFSSRPTMFTLSAAYRPKRSYPAQIMYRGSTGDGEPWGGTAWVRSDTGAIELISGAPGVPLAGQAPGVESAFIALRHNVNG